MMTQFNKHGIPVRPRQPLPRQCNNNYTNRPKLRYETETRARMAIAASRYIGRPYQCAACGYWHVTHTPKLLKERHGI